MPLSKFFIATLFGLMPMNIIHVKTGMMLNDIQQVGADFKVRFYHNNNNYFFRQS